MPDELDEPMIVRVSSRIRRTRSSATRATTESSWWSRCSARRRCFIVVSARFFGSQLGSMSCRCQRSLLMCRVRPRQGLRGGRPAGAARGTAGLGRSAGPARAARPGRRPGRRSGRTCRRSGGVTGVRHQLGWDSHEPFTGGEHLPLQLPGQVRQSSTAQMRSAPNSSAHRSSTGSRKGTLMRPGGGWGGALARTGRALCLSHVCCTANARRLHLCRSSLLERGRSSVSPGPIWEGPDRCWHDWLGRRGQGSSGARPRSGRRALRPTPSESTMWTADRRGVGSVLDSPRGRGWRRGSRSSSVLMRCGRTSPGGCQSSLRHRRGGMTWCVVSWPAWSIRTGDLAGGRGS